jgi:hypothetical protein
MSEGLFCAELLVQTANTPDKLKKATELVQEYRSKMSKRQIKEIDRLTFLVNEYLIKNQ